MNLKIIKFFLLIISIPFYLLGQNIINKYGLPFLKNYTPADYGSTPQNWAIIQDNRGIVYVANNELLLEYDGVSWRTYKMPNGSIVRSLAVDSNGIVYVGAVNEFGYLKPTISGDLKYQSLSNTLDSVYRNFGDIWRIFVHKKGVLFYSMNPTIFFQYNYSLPLLVYPVDKKNGPFFPFQIDSNIYVGHYYDGLKQFNFLNELNLVNGGEFYKEKDIFMIQHGFKDNVLLIGGPFGIYEYDRLTGVSTCFGILNNCKQIEKTFQKNLFYHGIRISNDIAVATHFNGMYILNKEGFFKFNVSEQNGLPINTIYGLYAKSSDFPLWLATDRGISKIEFNSSLLRFRCDFKIESDLSGVINDIINFENTIYVATTVGVYFMNPNKDGVYRFQKLDGIDGSAWTFLKFVENNKEKLLVGTHYDLFEIKNKKAISINRKSIDFETYKLIARNNKEKTFLLGYKKGVYEIKYANGRYDTLGKFLGINELIREICDNGEEIWVGTLYDGVIKIDANKKITRFNSPECGLLDFHMIKICKLKNNKIIFATKKGIYNFNKEKNLFEPDRNFPKRFWDGTLGINLIVADSDKVFVNTINNKNIQNIEILKFDEQSKNFFVIDSIVFKRILKPSVECIYPDSQYYWIGTSDAIYTYNSNYKKNYYKYYTFIRQVALGNDSIIFHGNYFTEKPDFIKDTNIQYILSFQQSEITKPTLAYKNNSLRIHFAAPFFEDEQSITFSHILEGYEETWSNWSSEPKAIYTNLYEGKYKFRVKARNIYGIESEEAVFEFTILPPWYRTWWAYGAYLILLGCFIWGIVVIATYRMKQINIAYGRYLPGAFLKLLEKRRVIDFRLGDMVEKEMTIMFSDIRSYTSLSESMHPVDNFKFLVRYLSHIGDMLHKNGGFPVQYYGDGVMAMFHGDTDNAVQAAIDMHAKVKEYSEERVKKGRRALQIGVGLHTGKIVMGIRGDARRWEGGIVGDAVNLAARMEGLTKMYGASTLISDDTFVRLKNPNKFLIRFIGKVKVKGKDVPVGMYEVLNGLPEDELQLKISTKELFDEALQNYFNKNLQRAKELFETVVKQNPKDVAASHYVTLCEKFIAEGITDDWDGVEKLDKK